MALSPSINAIWWTAIGSRQSRARSKQCWPEPALRASRSFRSRRSRARGIPTLADRLDAALRETASPPRTGAFRLAVDRVFTLAGLGTAVTGTVLSGTVQVEDRVLVSPSGLEARVRSINAQNRPVPGGRSRTEMRARAQRGADRQGGRAPRRCRTGSGLCMRRLRASTLACAYWPPSHDPSASGFRSGCITQRLRLPVVLSCCAMCRSTRARQSTCSSCWSNR